MNEREYNVEYAQADVQIPSGKFLKYFVTEKRSSNSHQAASHISITIFVGKYFSSKDQLVWSWKGYGIGCSKAQTPQVYHIV